MERKVKTPRRVFTVYIGLKCRLTGLNHESLHVVAHLSQALKIPRIVEKKVKAPRRVFTICHI